MLMAELCFAFDLICECLKCEQACACIFVMCVQQNVPANDVRKNKSLSGNSCSCSVSQHNAVILKENVHSPIYLLK